MAKIKEKVKVKDNLRIVILTGEAASYAPGHVRVAKALDMKDTEQAARAVVGGKFTLEECDNPELTVITYKVGVKGESTAIVISLRSS